MKNMYELHEKVFLFLYEWSEESRKLNNTVNPYFYMRSVRDERLRRGYWFPGNLDYICISFWAGGDSYSKTPNVFLDLNEKKGCSIRILAKDSEAKKGYFIKLIDDLNDADNKKFIQNKQRTSWTKMLGFNFEEWNECLSSFIVKEKRRIDEFIDHEPSLEVEEFVSRFGFITPKDFDTMLSRVLKERDVIKETEELKHRTFLDKPKLPFALLALTIENFQGIYNTSIADLNPDAQWIFITGENGYGKTSILQAIALGLNSNSDLEKYLDDRSRVSLEIINHNEKAFVVRSKGSISPSHSYWENYVIGYGPARLNVQAQSAENKEERSNANNVLSLFESDTPLKNLNYELFASLHLDKEAFFELQEIIKIVTKGRISEITVDEREAFFTETLSNGDKLISLPLKKLAAGFRNIINLVTDIYLRLKKTHRGIPFRNFFGIVLLDEIENHLHPIIQKELPTALSEVFPKIQFIITTHSPIPLLSAKKNSIILKVDRTKAEGVIMEKIEIDNLTSLTPNILFTSPIFGLSDIINDNIPNIQGLRTEDTWAEMKVSDELDVTLLKNYNDRKNNLK